MRTVISFNEGCSGNFLAALLSNSNIVTHLRIDDINNHLNYSIVPDLNFYTGTALKSIVVTHTSNSHQIKEVLKADQIIRIEPITGMFTAIYNVFIKKLINEDREDILDRWPAEPAYCYDRTFEHMKDYYGKFSKNMWTPDEILFDFGWIFDDEKMKTFFHHINASVDFNLIKRYQQSQLPLLLSVPRFTDMSSIVSQIPPSYFNQSPWFACYCLFCFELNNNLLETQRNWSIDHLPAIGADELIKLSFNYRN